MDDKKKDYDVLRSRRKTVGLELSRDGRLLVRAPAGLADDQIMAIVDRHRDWIRKHRAALEKEAAEHPPAPRLTADELRALADRAREVIPGRVAHYAPLIGVDYGRITIRHQKTRWGSCSSMGNLSFNCLLMLTPAEVIDSVVVHELCHRKQMNHSRRFYAEVLRVYPDYYKWNDWLKKNGSYIMRRMTG